MNTRFSRRSALLIESSSSSITACARLRGTSRADDLKTYVSCGDIKGGAKKGKMEKKS